MKDFKRISATLIWSGDFERLVSWYKEKLGLEEVDSVSKTYQILRDRGVKFLAEPFRAPTFDKHFATFCDLDGNTLQLIGGK